MPSDTKYDPVSEEFRAVKSIMSVVEKSWPVLGDDTRIWLKSRLALLPADTAPVTDIDEERSL